MWRRLKIGETHNGVKLIEDLGCDQKHMRHFRCLCPICGGTFIVRRENIGKTTHCKSCNSKNLVGMRFGLLTVIEKDETKSKGNGTYWKCRCDCGNYKVVKAICLKSGDTQSCGCLYRSKDRTDKIAEGARKKRTSASMAITGNVAEHPLYEIWQGIKKRCNNPTCSAYKYYGAKGVKICDRWSGENGFENFVNDMGERPSKKHSIDRIDVNGDYCPENCRWATMRTQMNNTTRNSYVIVHGEKMSVSEFSRLTGISNQSTSKFLCMGLDINYIVMNSHRYRKGKLQLREGHYNHNRVVSEEVMKMLEPIKNEDTNEQGYQGGQVNPSQDEMHRLRLRV